jgi:hypothetical protein
MELSSLTHVIIMERKIEPQLGLKTNPQHKLWFSIQTTKNNQPAKNILAKTYPTKILCF